MDDKVWDWFMAVVVAVLALSILIMVGGFIYAIVCSINHAPQ